LGWLEEGNFLSIICGPIRMRHKKGNIFFSISRRLCISFTETGMSFNQPFIRPPYPLQPQYYLHNSKTKHTLSRTTRTFLPYLDSAQPPLLLPAH
jgi:hypothetical protein